MSHSARSDKPNTSDDEESTDEQNTKQSQSQSEQAEEQSPSVSAHFARDQSRQAENPLGDQYITIAVEEYDNLHSKIAELEAQVTVLKGREAQARIIFNI
jgi:hypothetical protein